jgi:hypothetical protein
VLSRDPISLDHTGKFEVVDEKETGGLASEFGQAAATDGRVRITKYAETDWSEYFAECFSLYIMDPVTLGLLRPNIYRQTPACPFGLPATTGDPRLL